MCCVDWYYDVCAKTRGYAEDRIKDMANEEGLGVVVLPVYKLIMNQ